MCSNAEKRLIDKVHRILIAAGGATGALLDGIHIGDLFCIFSMSIWLMQTECRRLEELLIDRLRHRHP